jgi:putative tricarboxylic transport membrane protein
MTGLRFSALCLAAIGCSAAIVAIHLGLWSMAAPAAGLFPFIAAVALFVTGAAIAMSRLPQLSPGEPTDHVRLLHYCAAIASFAIAMKILGTFLATIFLMAVVLRWIEGKSWSQALTAAVSMAVLAWSLFDVLLGVPLPKGMVGIG